MPGLPGTARGICQLNNSPRKTHGRLDTKGKPSKVMSTFARSVSGGRPQGFPSPMVTRRAIVSRNLACPTIPAFGATSKHLRAPQMENTQHASVSGSIPNIPTTKAARHSSSTSSFRNILQQDSTLPPALGDAFPKKGEPTNWICWRENRRTWKIVFSSVWCF